MRATSLSSWVLAAIVSAALIVGPAFAQTAATPPSATTPAAPPPATTAPVPAATTPVQTPPAPTVVVPAAPAAATPAPAMPAPAAPSPDAAAPDKAPADTSISQTLDLPSRPAVIITGKATWDTGFKTIQDAFAKLHDALAKNNITANAHPLAVFTETDDNGFSFSAEIPLDKAPEGKTELTPEVKVGETPGGKAMRFQHRGAYEEIDSTYEAITAYLDEKGLEARNMFAEEYLNQVKTPDDSTLEVDIYVFLK